MKATVRWSDAEVAHRVRTTKLVTAVPVCRAALTGGEVGVAQVRELARVHANPRCGDQLDEVADTLVEQAMSLPYETFCPALRYWERLADADGAHRDAEATHAGRRVDFTSIDGVTHLAGQFGAAQGAMLTEVFEAM